MRDYLWDAYEVWKIFIGTVIVVGVSIGLLAGAVMLGIELGMWLSS